MQVVPAGTVPTQESGGSSPGESGGELGSEAKTYRSKEQLMLRANSLKKALRQIIEQAEKGEPPSSFDAQRGCKCDHDTRSSSIAHPFSG